MLLEWKAIYCEYKLPSQCEKAAEAVLSGPPHPTPARLLYCPTLCPTRCSSPTPFRVLQGCTRINTLQTLYYSYKSAHCIINMITTTVYMHSMSTACNRQQIVLAERRVLLHHTLTHLLF